MLLEDQIACAQTTVSFSLGDGLFEPGDVRGLSFSMLGAHVKCTAKIVVAADNMKRCKRHAPHRPAQILTKFCMLCSSQEWCAGRGCVPRGRTLSESLPGSRVDQSWALSGSDNRSSRR